MTQVRIADLLASSPVDATAHLDSDRVRHYAELPGDPPPVVAFSTEQGLILADGYHRVAAAQARGLDSSGPRELPKLAVDAAPTNSPDGLHVLRGCCVLDKAARWP